MAEEKTKEVKAEKKFCTKCGKEIKEGVEHQCTQSSAAANSVTADALMNGVKNFFLLIGDSFKKPATTIKKQVENANWKHALITLAIISLTFGLFVSLGMSALADMLEENRFLIISDDIPYFKTFIYMTLLHYIVAFVPICVAFVVGRIHKNNDFDFKKAICLYTYSLLPTIPVYLILALLCGLDILVSLGMIIGAVVIVICFFHFIFGFNNLVKFSEDRKSYAISGLVIAWTVLSVILSGVLFINLLESFAELI